VSDTFDAGSIESRLVLDRSDFLDGLHEMKAEAQNFERQKFKARVGLDTTGAKRDLAAFKADLNSLRNVSLNIGVSGSNAQIRAISQSASALDGRNIGLAVQIRGITDASAQLRTLRQQVDALDGRTININANVDTASAMAHIAALEARLASLSSTHTTVTASTNRLGGAFTGAAGGAGDLLAVALLLAPALVPIGAGALAVGGGLVTMAVAGGAAFGIFGAAVFGAVKNVQGLSKTLDEAKKNLATQRAALDQLKPGTDAYANQLHKVDLAQQAVNKASAAFTPQQRQFSTAIKGLKSEWQGFVQSTSSTTLPIASTFVGALTAAVPKLIPVVRAVAPVANSVALAFKGWVDSGLDTWVSWVASNGVPILKNFEGTGRNLAGVFGEMLRAFAPLAQTLAAGLEHTSADVAGWSADGGFQTFLGYVHDNGPALKQFFTALGGALRTVALAVKDMGPVALSTTVLLLRLMAALSPDQVQALAYAFIGVRLAMLAYNGYTALATAYTWAFGAATGASRASLLLTRIGLAALWVQMQLVSVWTAITSSSFWALTAAMLANPMTWVVLGIAALIAAIVLVATKTDWFQKAWKAAWGAIKTGAAAVWDFLNHGLGQFTLLLAGPVGVLAFLALHWKQEWGLIQSTSSAVWGFIRDDVLNPIGRFFTKTVPGWANTFYTKGFKAPFDSSRAAAVSAYNAIRDHVFSPLGSFFTKKIPGWAGTMRDKTKQAFSELRDGIGTVWKGIEKVTAAPINFVINDVYNSGIRRVWNDVAGAVGLSKLKLPAMSTIKYAQGGAIEGGVAGIDNRQILAMPNEHIWTAEEVKNFGGHRALANFRAGFSSTGKARVAPGQNNSHYDLGGAISGAWDATGGKVVSGVADGAGWLKDKADGLVRGALGAVVNPVLDKIAGVATSGVNRLIPGTPPWQSLVGGTATAPIKWMKDWISKDDKNHSVSFAGGVVPSRLHKLIIDAALKAAHIPPPGAVGQWETGLNTLVTRESGWNASAVNRTDSNAAAGHPSMGLAQTILGTFNAYVPASLRSLGILNPTANIAAAARYIVSRYGNITNVQQANASLPPKGYKAGGITIPGIHVAGENGPELIATSGGDRVFTAQDTERMLRGAAAAASGSSRPPVRFPDKFTLVLSDGRELDAFLDEHTRATMADVFDEADRSR
jgi:hypothetical protein